MSLGLVGMPDTLFDRPVKTYLAGPMTGYPQFNFPLFDSVAAELRGVPGIEVVSPAELDDPKSRAAALQSEWGDPEEYKRLTGLTWADFLSRDVKLIADGGFDSIICLPKWFQSRGARLETFVGYLNGIPIMDYRDHIVGPVGIVDLASAWAGMSPDMLHADLSVALRLVR